MTMHKPPQAMTLFDLIARTWVLDTDVRHVLFNGAGTSVVAVLGDGRMAFFSVNDAEHPESRVRVEADTGRPSIRPRTKPLPLPVVSEEPVARPDVLLCRLGEQGFAFSHADSGALWRATGRGQTLRVSAAPTDAVTALAAAPRNGRVLMASDKVLVLAVAEGGAEICSATLPHEVSRIVVSPDGRVAGCWGGGQVSLVSTEDLRVRKTVPCVGQVSDMAWSPCARWLVAGCEDKAVVMVDAQAGIADRIVDFPAAVRTVGFSDKAGTMVASGAFRVVGWDLPDLPFGEHEGTPIETGKPGLTIVDRIAVHPKRDLCAVSYVNGLVMICRIGHPDEMLLREGTGAAVNALAWSDDGAHLAIAGEDGSLSITTFPKNMFK